MQKTVTYPRHVTAGILPNHRAYPRDESLRLFGADTETVHGTPHTVQVWAGPHRDGGLGVQLIYTSVHDILSDFWSYMRPRLREGGVNLCYFHNLKFDLMILLADHHLEVYEQGASSEFFTEIDGSKLKRKLAADPLRPVLRVEVLFGKVNAMTISEGRHYLDEGDMRFRPKVELKVYDSRAFTQAGLSRSLAMFKIPEVKLESPAGLGDKPLRTPEFEAYAKQDVVAEWKLAERIMGIHHKYKVRPSISLPQFASRVFRHDFFKPGDKIEFPPVEIVKAAELSYHGGKNGFYAEPGVYEDVTEVDINSAYPWAMHELPNFTRGSYETVDSWAGPDVAGIYEISGWTDPKAIYPLVFDSLFKRVDGHFDGVWTTSYEFERIASASFVRITKIRGYVWREHKSHGGNPFRAFVDHFFRLKNETPRDDPYYQFYKIVLNALYGKLVGVVEERELIDLEGADMETSVRKDFKWDSALGKYVKSVAKSTAGQMYNPFIATLITGKVRALLYDLEVKYKALHSATDSIKTRMKISEKPGLGGWKEECSGRCWIFRNKLYLHFDKTGKKGAVRGIFDEGAKGKAQPMLRQGLCKYALHAYKGTVEDLYKNRVQLLKDGKMDYEFTHVVGLREGLRRGETPGDFVRRTETLNLRRAA